MINPDLEPPRLLIDKLLEASTAVGNHRYAVSRGVRKLRSAFALKYQRSFNVDLDPESQICVTMGSKDALLHALMCLKGTNKAVLVGSPTYPAHLAAIRLAGFECGFFDLSSDEAVMLSALERAFKTDRYSILFLNFPNNPTGMVVSSDFYRGLLALAQRHDVFVLNDFVYGEMGFEAQQPVSLLALPGFEELGAESYSLSKAYSVPGWRVGALAGNRELVRRLGGLKSQIDYGVFLPLQIAAAAALSSKETPCTPIVQAYRERCRQLRLGLERLGWKVQKPEAGASVWAEMPNQFRSEGSLAFVARLLTETGVLGLPGFLFGEQYDSFVRFAAVVPEEKIHETIAALGNLGVKEEFAEV